MCVIIVIAAYIIISDSGDERQRGISGGQVRN
jgi:hypothetical protein